MKSQRAIAYIVVAAAVGIGVMGLQATRAQYEEPFVADADADVTAAVATDDVPGARSSGRAFVPPVVNVNPDDVRDHVERSLSAAGLHGPHSVEAEIRKAAEKLRDAEGDEAKANARQELANLLGRYFDEDMARREQELAKLEERLRKLTAQLQRRRAKRQDIINLQIEVAVNEADGLGFLSRPVHGIFPGTSGHFYGAPSIKISEGEIKISDGDRSLTLPTPTPNLKFEPTSNE